jgi:FdhD protein
VTVRTVSAVGPGGALTSKDDEVVVEEPLEIRVGGDALATTMRTPGSDADLALGFLFGEGIVAEVGDVGSVAHCGRPGEEGYGNTIDVAPGPGVALDPERLASSRRGTLTTAACGVCGRRSIDDLLARVGRIEVGRPVALDILVSSTERLRSEQPNFTRTGGVHAAAALTAAGARLAVFEDVGRHNAVDKVMGELLRRGLVGAKASSVSDDARPEILVVSGRVSFEIVQKAAVARIPIIAAVSAPTSLAIDLAERVGITLIGFVRDGRLNVYSHRERIEGVA